MFKHSFKFDLHFFYMNTRLSFDQNLRTIPALAEEQSIKFWVKVVNKCRTISKVHFASRFIQWIHE